MASGEIPSNEEQKNPENWRVEEPEEAKYNFSDEKGVWQPKPEDILSLFEKLAGGGSLPLKWHCPGRRPPKSKEDVAEETDMEHTHLEQEEEKEEKPVAAEASAFDFDEFSGDPNTKLTPIRAPGGTGRTPRTKKRACMDNIMDSLRRQHLQTVAEREARRARGSPSGTPKSRIFGMKRSAAPTLALAAAVATTASPSPGTPVATTPSVAVPVPADTPVVPSCSHLSESNLMSEPRFSNDSLTSATAATSAGLEIKSTLHPVKPAVPPPAVTRSDSESVPSTSVTTGIGSSTAQTTATLTPSAGAPLPSVFTTSESQAQQISPEISGVSLQHTNQSRAALLSGEATSDSPSPAIPTNTTTTPNVTSQEMTPVVAHSTSLSTSNVNTGLALSSTATVPSSSVESSQALITVSASITDIKPSSSSPPRSTEPGSTATAASSTQPILSTVVTPTQPPATIALPVPQPPATATLPHPPAICTAPAEPTTSPPLLPPPYTVTVPLTTATSDSMSAPVPTPVSTPDQVAVTSSQQPPPVPPSDPSPAVSQPSTTTVEPELAQSKPSQAEAEHVTPDALTPENLTPDSVEKDTKSLKVDEKS